VLKNLSVKKYKKSVLKNFSVKNISVKNNPPNFGCIFEFMFLNFRVDGNVDPIQSARNVLRYFQQE